MDTLWGADIRRSCPVKHTPGGTETGDDKTEVTKSFCPTYEGDFNVHLGLFSGCSVRIQECSPNRCLLRTYFPGISSISYNVDQLMADPELKVTCWLGQGLQHRTWVLPLLPARVLCCSQWSC